MKKRKFNMFFEVRKMKGITLTSLVITIVIMLILVAVVLNLILGDNGLLKKSKNAKTIYENLANDEDDDLIALESEIDKMLANNGELIENNNKIGIYNNKQLDTLKSNIKNGNTYEGKKIIFGNDINLNEGKYNINDDGTVTFLPNADKWESIGDEDHPFSGTIDGKNFIITGLYIDNDKDNQGFVGYNKGIIKNIGIKYGYVKANDCVGAIVGMNQGNIINVFNEIPINGNYYVGGIVGQSKSEGISNIENSCNLGKVIGLNYVGGIIGVNYNLSNEGRKNIINCYNAGNIRSTDSESNRPQTGGIVGWNAPYSDGKITVQNCYSVGKIVGNYQTDTGGIVGKNSSGIITNSYYLFNTVNGDNDPIGLDKGKYKTSEELKYKSTYLNWDFDEIWYERENDYPSLRLFKDKL